MRSTPRILNLPDPEALPPGMSALADAIREVTAQRAERDQAALAARQAQGDLPKAQADDRLETAKALRDRKPDPAGRHESAIIQRIAKARRQASAWDLNVAEAEAALLGLVADHAAANAQVLADLETEARQALGAALEGLTKAVNDLTATKALGGFLASAMDPTSPGVRYNPAPGILKASGLKRLNGEAYLATEVLAALRPLAQAPEEPAAPANIQPLQPRPVDRW